MTAPSSQTERYLASCIAHARAAPPRFQSRRQPHPEHTPLPRHRLHAYLPAVRLHDPLHDHEPHPAPRMLAVAVRRAPEHLENRAVILGREPTPLSRTASTTDAPSRAALTSTRPVAGGTKRIAFPTRFAITCRSFVACPGTAGSGAVTSTATARAAICGCSTSIARRDGAEIDRRDWIRLRHDPHHAEQVDDHVLRLARESQDARQAAQHRLRQLVVEQVVGCHADGAERCLQVVRDGVGEVLDLLQRFSSRWSSRTRSRCFWRRRSSSTSASTRHRDSLWTFVHCSSATGETEKFDFDDLGEQARSRRLPSLSSRANGDGAISPAREGRRHGRPVV